MTRFRLLAASVGLVLVAACGTTDDAPTAAESDGAFPVTIDHKFGGTTVDAQPQRVVTVGWNDQDFALSLGVVPVATRQWFDEYPTYPWVREARGDAPIPTFSADIDYEAISAQNPDLILAVYESIDQATYDGLSKIAPTVIQTADYENEQTPWDVQTLTTGKALGKSDEAEALVARVQGKIDDAKAAHPEFAQRVLVEDFGPENGQHYLLPAGDPRRALFDALGFGAQEESEEVSEERADLLDRDVLFVNGATKDQMVQSPVFSSLSAVTQDRTLYTTFDGNLGGALAYSGPDALEYALDVLVPQLANAADNDPSTPVMDLSAA
ncbi:ABC transporter substrate-binding protein [Actinomycetes bacterium M1A6_2h]